MAAPRGKKQPGVNGNTEVPKDRAVRIVRVKKNDDVKTLYAKVRDAFTAADLQRYTRDEEMMPAEQLVKELEAMERQGRKRKTKRPAR